MLRVANHIELLHKPIDVVLVARVWFVRTIELIRAYFISEALVRRPGFVFTDVLKWIRKEPKSIDLLLAKVSNDGNAKKENALIKPKSSSSLDSLIIENTLRW